MDFYRVENNCLIKSVSNFTERKSMKSVFHTCLKPTLWFAKLEIFAQTFAANSFQFMGFLLGGDRRIQRIKLQKVACKLTLNYVA